MSRNKKLSLAAAVILILYSLTGFFLIPYLVQKILPGKLSEALKRPVTIREARFNPYTLTMSLEDFSVAEQNGTTSFLSFNRLLVNVQMSSLFRMGLVLKEISLDAPVIHITRISDTSFNFSDLLEEPEEEAPEPPEEETPFPFSISNLQIVNGKIEVEDQVVQKTHTISDLYFSLPFISSFEKHLEIHTKPGLKLQVNDTEITADVSAKPFTDSMEATLDLNISGINLSSYMDYLPGDIGFIITGGLLNVQSHVDFTKPKDEPSVVKISGTIALSGLELMDADKIPLAKLEKMDLELAPSRILEKEIHLKKIALTKPEIDIQRNASGAINLTAIAPPSDAAADSTPNSETDPETSAEPKDASPPSDMLRLLLDDFSIRSGWVRFQDHFVSESAVKPLKAPVEIALGPIQLNVANFSTIPNQKAGQKADFNFSSRINRQGDMEINGQFGISPLLMNSQYAFNDIDFSWIEPYLQEQLSLAVTSGRFTSSGKVTVETDEEKEWKATLVCDASIEDLKTADKVRGEDFLQIGGLFVKQVDVTYHPTRVVLGEIAIQDFTNRIIVHEDGTLNLNRILISKTDEEGSAQTAEKEKAEPPAEASPAVPIVIHQVTLKDIRIDFLDKQIRPSFSTNINLTKGSITGLTSENFQAADVSIHGNIDDSPIEITGKINPFQENLFTDIQFKMKEMELSPLTPYSGKFIGKAVEKGKLSLDLEYQIEKKILSAQYRILFDQLSLGQRMDSPDASDLPVGLVISILKDRKGQIKLDIPVSGRLDDPEFSLKGVILQTLVNTVEKAATSPFALVSGIAGGGEELQFIEFQPGRHELDEKARMKLDSVITVLYERPGLKLGLTGYVDDQKDRSRLAEIRFDQKIKTQKRLALIRDGRSPAPVEQIEVGAYEYPDYLRQAYLAEISASPNETVSRDAMEYQLRKTILISDSELRQLSLNRAGSVKAYILQDARIEPGRLFLTEAATLFPEHQDQYADGRVELSLR